MNETRVELEIDNIAHEGVCVGRHEGRVVFVPGVIPGERVLVQLREPSGNAKKPPRFLRADPVEVLEPSPDRKPQVWPEADMARPIGERVGGAEFGHIQLQRQHELKLRVLTDALQRVGKGVEPPHELKMIELPELHWRTRVRLHVNEQGQAGPYAAGSHSVIPVQDLPLAAPALNELRAHRESWPAETDSLDLVVPSMGWDQVGVGQIIAAADTAKAAEPLVERVGEREFTRAAGGFWQVHWQAPQRLTSAVHTAMRYDDTGYGFDETANNLDLYGGVGLLGAAMLDVTSRYARILSVEADAAASHWAWENLREYPGWRTKAAPVARFLAQQLRATHQVRQRYRTATVVADPPRTGLGKQVVTQLGQLMPSRIILVACDPVAFARDAALLQEEGYSWVHGQVLDLFPNTYHFETVGVFDRIQG